MTRCLLARVSVMVCKLFSVCKVRASVTCFGEKQLTNIIKTSLVFPSRSSFGTSLWKSFGENLKHVTMNLK